MQVDVDHSLSLSHISTQRSAATITNLTSVFPLNLNKFSFRNYFNSMVTMFSCSFSCSCSETGVAVVSYKQFESRFDIQLVSVVGVWEIIKNNKRPN